MSASPRLKSVLAALASITVLAAPCAPARALEVNVPGVKLPADSPQAHVTVPGAGVDVGPGGVGLTVGQPPASPPPPGPSTTPSMPKPAAGGTSSGGSSSGSAPAASAPSRPGGRTGSVVPATPAASGAAPRGSARTGAAGTSSPRSKASGTPVAVTRPVASRKPVPAGPSAAERIVQRIPSEFLAALCAALLAAVAFALVWIRERRRARRARRVALADPLTGIPNRLAFYERLGHEWGRARRYDRELGLILLDMDGLKQINDSEGHAAGDRALVSIAETLSGDIRQSDLAARLAGDEFVVLCPETGGEGLHNLASKLQRSLDAEGAGMSVGVAEYDSADLSPEDLLARADEAMYEDKTARRPAPRLQPTAQPGLARRASPALPAS